MTTTEHPITEHLAKLRGYALHLTRSDADADDLVQDVAERALGLWAAYEANLRNLGGWLRLLCYQEFCRRYRKVQRRAEVPADDNGYDRRGDMRHDVAAFEARQQVDVLMSVLPATQRTAVERIYLHGETDVEAAAEIECPRATVRTRVHRALREMRSA